MVSFLQQFIQCLRRHYLRITLLFTTILVIIRILTTPDLTFKFYNSDAFRFNTNSNYNHSNINPKHVAFLGNINAWRLGGGELMEITKQFLANPVLPPKNNMHQNRISNNSMNYLYQITSTDLINLGNNGSLFDTEWCVCNYFLGWILQWKIDIIYWNKAAFKDKYYYQYITKNIISKYDVIFIYQHGYPLHFPTLDVINNIRKEPQHRYIIEVEPEHAVKWEMHSQEMGDTSLFITSYQKPSCISNSD